MFAFTVFIQDSWVVALKGRFKNLRRGIPTMKYQLEWWQCSPKQGKAAKALHMLWRCSNPWYNSCWWRGISAPYEDAAAQQELAKTIKHNGAIKTLMQNTFHHW